MPSQQYCLHHHNALYPETSMVLCVEFDQKDFFTIPVQTKLWGSWPGCCLQRPNCFKHLWRVFFRSSRVRGHEPEPGVDGSRHPLLSFFLLLAASWGQAAAENSPDTRPKSEDSTVGVFSCKTSLANQQRQKKVQDRSQTQITLRRVGPTTAVCMHA